MEQVIIDPAEQNSAGFNYAELPTDDAEFLRAKAAYINARKHLTHQLITEMGTALIEAKGRLPGVFLAWARLEFEFSDDTIENYMNVAARFPALEGSGGLIQARALYKLSGMNVPDSVRTEAGQLANNGNPVDYKTAYILAEAPPEIKTRYLSEELPKESAYEMAKIYKKKSLPQTVREVCIAQKVSSPELVLYLAEAWTDYQHTKGTIHERSTYDDIEKDNWNLNGIGWSVPISQARPVDIDRYRVDRAFMHRDAATPVWDWVQTQGRIEKNHAGHFILVTELPDFIGKEGMLIMSKVRLPVKESKK